MKNTHDPFGDELKNRLANYSEEPDDALWSGIASNIETVKPPVTWTKWLSIGSLVVVMTGALLYLTLNDSVNEDIADAASASLAETTKKESNENVSTQPSNESKSVQTESALATVGNQPNQSATVPIVEGSEAHEETDNATTSRERQKINNVQVEERNRPTSSGNNQLARRNRAVPNAATDSSIENVAVKAERNQSAVAPNQLTAPLTKSRVADASVADALNNKEEMESKEQVETHRTLLETDDVALAAKVETTAKDSEIVKINVADTPVETQSSEVVKEEKKQEDETTTEKKELKQDVASKSDDKKDDKAKPNRKLSLYLTAMPTFGYQRIEANQNDNIFIESISKVSNFSTKRLGVRAEVGAEYALSRKLRAFGGILYYQRKQTIDYVERVPVNGVVETDVDTLVIIKPEFASTSRTFEYELRNIGIQLGVNYVLKEKKFLHTIGTGIEFHKALNKLPEDQQALGFSSNPSTYVFANLYYRLQYPAQGKLRAVFQPTFNYSLYLNQDTNAPFFVKPYGLGLNVGVTYHF